MFNLYALEIIYGLLSDINTIKVLLAFFWICKFWNITELQMFSEVHVP